MLVSWNWLKDYVELTPTVEELTDRLTISGLNLEGLQNAADDLVIDLEVTSNRPDCLGHLGVAREIAVLTETALRRPDPQPPQSDPSVDALTSVENRCPDLCRRYTARVIRGVKVGPSPDWLADRLSAIGIAVVNNIVDITNYVMFECAQPLHAFDFSKLVGPRIVVRQPAAGEEIVAIDHRTYKLDPTMCVIADAQNAVALGGVMGGAETEVALATTDLLIEAADFDPLTIRNTARQLNLHSPSSYRFERGVDPEGIDWASRRCSELILELAGGELAAGVADTAPELPRRSPITLRLSQLPRVLGIEISSTEVRKILTALGLEEVRADAASVEVIPPSWRADLTREIDLVEEVARIHGYDKIPEDVGVAMTVSARTREDIVVSKVRDVLVAAGFDEAVTISAVERAQVETFRPWTDAEPLYAATPVLRRADRLRQSLVPSLLSVRRTNETLSNATIELFEIARIYLPRQSELPDERRMLTLSSGGGFLQLKGVVEALQRRVAPNVELTVEPWDHDFFQSNRACRFRLGDHDLGFLGEVAPAGLDSFGLKSATTVAELNVDVLIAAAELTPQATLLSNYPPVQRDLNLVFDEAVQWADVDRIVRDTGGDVLESLSLEEVYRDQERLGAEKKSFLVNVRLRSARGTLTNEQADALRDRVVARLGSELGGTLRA